MFPYHAEGRFLCVASGCTFVGTTRQSVYNHQGSAHAKHGCQFEGRAKSFGSQFKLKVHERIHRAFRHKGEWPDYKSDYVQLGAIVVHIRIAHFRLHGTVKE